MCKLKLNDGVIITLTKDQIDQQRSKITHYTQIKSYQDACKVLDIKEDFNCDNANQLKTVARAINKLIDNNTNFPDWKDTNQAKWKPVFELSKSGWLLTGVYGYRWFSFGSLGLLKTEEAGRYFGETFIDLFIPLLEEKY